VHRTGEEAASGGPQQPLGDLHREGPLLHGCVQKQPGAFHPGAQGPGLSEDPGRDPHPDLPGRAAGRTPDRQAGGLAALPRGEAGLDRERARSLLLARASAVPRLRRRQGRPPVRNPPILAESRGEGSLQCAALSRGGEGPGGGGVRPGERVPQWGGTLLPRLPDAGGAGAERNRERDRRATGRARSRHPGRDRETAIPARGLHRLRRGDPLRSALPEAGQRDGTGRRRPS
jgi:hypothetical protein